ncbi:unnamed protein product, partial [Choristocarpus tenellus]
LASIFCSISCLRSLNVGWNNLSSCGGLTLAPALLVFPFHLVTLELPFNGLTDNAGVAFGGLLPCNVSLEILDLSHNRLGIRTALSIATGLK